MFREFEVIFIEGDSDYTEGEKGKVIGISRGVKNRPVFVIEKESGSFVYAFIEDVVRISKK